jgi:hypothetical protein
MSAGEIELINQDPTQTTRLEDGRLVIDDCVICGDTHYHGGAAHEPGDTTHRFLERATRGVNA